MPEHPHLSDGTRPVPVFLEHLLRLEAAIAACLSESGERQVHKLRTETRRVGALLRLLDGIPDVPEHRQAARELRRELTALRRAAGEVRDLDVHRGMLEKLLAEGISAPVPPEEATEPGEAKTSSALERSAHKLLASMSEKRHTAAHRLRRTLEKRLTRTAEAAGRVVAQLAPAESLVLSTETLLGLAEKIRWQGRRLPACRPRQLGEEKLHDLRKGAKAARYVAEIAPGEPTLREAAERFEALQEAGGEWHDALELERAARKRFGARHRLALLYRQSRREKLGAYRQALDAELHRARERKAPSETAKRPASRRTKRASPAAKAIPKRTYSRASAPAVSEAQKSRSKPAPKRPSTAQKPPPKPRQAPSATPQ